MILKVNGIRVQLSEISESKEIDKYRYSLQERLLRGREEEFALKQSNDDSIRNIIIYLESLESPRSKNSIIILDRPAYLEWAVWRGFLAIDHFTIPVYKTRRFPLNDDLLPRNFAPGGGADMVFEFEEVYFY